MKTFGVMLLKGAGFVAGALLVMEVYWTTVQVANGIILERRLKEADDAVRKMKEEAANE